jgi:Condensation domain
LNPVTRKNSARGIVKRAPSDQDPPLSFAQQRLWFLEQLEPGSNLYNIGRALRLSGRLDLPALKATLSEIIRRHESLRTTFTTVKGVPVQRVASEAQVSVEIVDLAESPETDKEAFAERFAKEDAARSFDLATGPLARFTLLKLDPSDWVLVFTIHHIVSDGWSTQVLLREMALLYEAFCDGRPSPLPELPIQYADYAVWQREAVNGPALEKHLAYWKRRLSGAMPNLSLPYDRPWPETRSFIGGKDSLSLNAELSRALVRLGRLEAATPFMTLLAAFKVLLHCYASQLDILVGTPVAGRSQFETEPLIGFFVNTLVLRSDLSGDPSFRELLKRVRQTVWEALAHQDLPFEKLVEELQPQRDLNRSPFFQVMFNMVNLADETLKVRDLTLTSMSFLEDQPKFDLVLYGTEQGDKIELNLVYDSDLFNAETISDMLDSLKLILVRLAINPNARLSELRAAFEEAAQSRRAIREKEMAQRRRQSLGVIKRKPVLINN